MKKYPFKFLDAYNKEDTDIFFGRDEEIGILYEMVFQSSILLIYGASGTGKTSLIQCGLASRFQSHDWLALTIRRGSNINEAFEKALADAGGNTPLEQDDIGWLEEVMDEKEVAVTTPPRLAPLAQSLKAVYLNSFRPIYLIFDQFEELFILGSTAEQQQFIETVKEILQVEQPVKMIFSIREEYLGHLNRFERAVPQLLRKKLRVEPMNLDKVRQVIIGATGHKNSNVRLKKDETDLVAEGIFDKIKGKEKTLTIQLPYLQVFLDKFYLEITKDETRQAEAVFTSEALNKIGDIGDVLRNFLEEQVTTISRKLSATYPDISVESIWNILSPFATLEGTKEPINKQGLYDRLPGLSPVLIDATVEAFINSRILRYTEDVDLYEIAHDSLAKRIAEKRSDEEIAILEIKRLVKSQTALKAEARELFSEKQLNFIEPFLEKIKLTEEEGALINQSYEAVAKQKAAEKIQQEAETQRLLEKQQLLEKNQRSQKRFIRWITVALIAMIGLAIWAYSQKRDADLAKKAALESAVSARNSDSLSQIERIKALRSAAAAISSDSIAQIARINAETQKAIAESKTKEALSQKEANQTQLARNYWNNAQLVRTENNLLKALHLIAEGITISKDEYLTQNMLLDIEAFLPQVFLKNIIGGNINIAVFSPDGRRVLTASDSTVRLWDAASGEQIGPDMKHGDIVTSATFSPNGKLVLTASEDKTARLWDAGSSKQIGPYIKHDDAVLSAVFSPDGKLVLTASDSTARLWDAGSGKQIGPDIKHGDAVLSAVFSPDGKLVLTASDSTARLWDAGSDKQIGPDMKHGDVILSAVFSPNGKQVLTVSEDKTGRLWYTASGEKLPAEHRGGGIVYSAFYNADGSTSLTVDNNIVVIMDEASSQSMGTIMQGNIVYSAFFSPDGKLILTACKDGTARIWGAEGGATGGKQIGIEMKHGAAVTNAVFSPDGKQVLTVSENNTVVRLWDLDKSAVFSPDGERILKASKDHTAGLVDAVGDLDIPADLFKLQARVATGWELNNKTGEIELIPTKQWYELKEEYYNKAREHYKTCKYRQYNFWSRFYPEEAEKVLVDK